MMTRVIPQGLERSGEHFERNDSMVLMTARRFGGSDVGIGKGQPTKEPALLAVPLT